MELCLQFLLSQYEWTDNLTDVPNKINDIFTPFIVISNIRDVLIKEVLIDSTFLIIKENINCSNFLNKDRFNLLIERDKYKSLTDIIISNERLYEEALFHIFSQNEINSNTYKTDRILVDIVKFLNTSHYDIDRFHHDIDIDRFHLIL